MTPRRPNPYQITDSEYAVTPTDAGFQVIESWWHIDRHGDSDHMEERLRCFPTKPEAEAWIATLTG